MKTNSLISLLGLIGTILGVIGIAWIGISWLGKFPMVNLLLGIATIMGGIAALVYFLEGYLKAWNEVYQPTPTPTPETLVEQRYFQSLELNRELGRNDSMARDYADLGNFYKKQGKLIKAEKMYRNSFQLYREIGDSHAEVVQQWLAELQTTGPSS
jgi:tetratricopeptide (TPR) repeat protein